jgi:hypothetical protein
LSPRLDLTKDKDRAKVGDQSQSVNPSNAHSKRHNSVVGHDQIQSHLQSQPSSYLQRAAIVAATLQAKGKPTSKGRDKEKDKEKDKVKDSNKEKSTTLATIKSPVHNSSTVTKETGNQIKLPPPPEPAPGKRLNLYL